jgi:hypothetical protein
MNLTRHNMLTPLHYPLKGLCMRLISELTTHSIKFLFLIVQFLLIFIFIIVVAAWLGTFINLVAIMWTWDKVVTFVRELL